MKWLEIALAVAIAIGGIVTASEPRGLAARIQAALDVGELPDQAAPRQQLAASPMRGLVDTGAGALNIIPE